MRISDLYKIFQNVRGPCILLANGSHIDLQETPIVSGVTETDHIEGSFAITSHETGRGYLFRSNGVHWVRDLRPPGSGIAAIEEDENPTLGGDLELNGFAIKGELENENLILDGGLI